MSSRVVVTNVLFRLSSELLAELRSRHERHAEDEITHSYDAFLLDPGLGPATYLTSDGRVIWDDDIWDVKGTRAEAFAAIRGGIHKTGIARLSELLPRRTSDSSDCPACNATGRFDAHGQLRDTQGRAFSIVCGACGGLGWTAPSLRLNESVCDPP